jgi:hypothetical protein
MWEHHVNTNIGGGIIPRNSFYGTTHPSIVEVVFNDSPSTVKEFKTVNYEGSQAKINQFTSLDSTPESYYTGEIVYSDDETEVDADGNPLPIGAVTANWVSSSSGMGDGEYYNLVPKSGWYVSHMSTDLENGQVPEFINKEGKWFNKIYGLDPGAEIINTEQFNLQGVGMTSNVVHSTVYTEPSDDECYNENGDVVDCDSPDCVGDGCGDGDDTVAVMGCMNELASNYAGPGNTLGEGGTELLPVATIDDGSCTFDVYGCMDSTAINYNSTATIDNGTCYYVVGCQDPTALNYDALADMSGYITFVENLDGVVVPNYNLCSENTPNCGCTYGDVDNSCPDGQIWNPFIVPPGCVDDGSAEEECVCYDEDGNDLGTTSVDCCGGGDEVSELECDPGYIIQDEECVLEVCACTVIGSTNYQGANLNGYYPLNADGNGNPFPTDFELVDDGDGGWTFGDWPIANASCDDTCIAFITPILGCTDITACNYDWTANENDGSCEYSSCGPGCTDSTMANYCSTCETCLDMNDEPNGTAWVGSAEDPDMLTVCCIPEGTIISGCTDPTACNYNENANSDDGSCEYVTCAGCTDSSSCDYDSTASIDDGTCFDYVSCYGCTDPSAINYDATATFDDGSCVAAVLGCTDSTAFNYDPDANTDDGSCQAVVYGCMDEEAFNYDIFANTDDGSCVPIVYGCIDITMSNYNPNANTSNSDCIPWTIGCMDPSSLNYNPDANTNVVMVLSDDCTVDVYNNNPDDCWIQGGFDTTSNCAFDYSTGAALDIDVTIPCGECVYSEDTITLQVQNYPDDSEAEISDEFNDWLLNEDISDYGG